MNKIKPRNPVPSTPIQVLDGREVDIGGPTDKKFRIIFFYRGYHCPIGRFYLHDVQVKVSAFGEAGVELIAVSCDVSERARMAHEEWHIPDLPVGYGMKLEDARQWGLYISESHGRLEPDLFSEPGIFIVQPGGRLYGSIVQTMPFPDRV